MRTLSIFLIGVISFFPAIVQPNSTTAVPSSSPIISKDTAFTFYESFKKLTPPYPIYISSYPSYDGYSVCTFHNINLCEKALEIRYQEERERAGPHQDTVVDLYVNTLAESAISQKLATFPSGAVTVLVVRAEHAIKSFSEFGSDVIAPSSIYAMLKRAPGFDPQNGDWEYFVASKKDISQKLSGLPPKSIKKPIIVKKEFEVRPTIHEVRPIFTALGDMIKRAAGFDPQLDDGEYFYDGTSREFVETGGFAKGRLKSCIACHAKAKGADYVFVRNPDNALHREIYGLQILDSLDREEKSPSITPSQPK